MFLKTALFRFYMFLVFVISGTLFCSANTDAEDHWRVFPGMTLPTLTDDQPSLGVAGPITGFFHHRLLIGGGGATFSDTHDGTERKKVWHRDIHLLDLLPDGSYRWSGIRSQLPVETGYATSVTTPDGIAVLGGENQHGLLDRAYLLVWDALRGTVTLDMLPPLPEPCMNGAAAFLGNTIYLIGGNVPSGTTSRVIALDLTDRRQGWQSKPKLPRPVAYGAVVCQSDGVSPRLWFIGGRARPDIGQPTEFFNNVYSLAPNEKSWREEHSLTNEKDIPKRLAALTAVPLGASSIVVFGGDNGRVFQQKELNQLQADQADDPDEKKKFLDENRRLSQEFEGYDRTILLYNTITKRWCQYGTLPFETPVATTALQLNNRIYFPSGEIKPGVQSPEVQIIEPVFHRRFGGLNYAVLFLYLGAMLALGFFFMRGNRDADSFFHGGGQLPWWAVGISIFATMLSAITFLSIPAKAYVTNWNMLFYNLGITMAAPLVIAFYLPRFRQIKGVSAYQYLEGRFNRLTRWFASGLFVIFMITRIAIVLYLPAIAMNMVSGINVWFCIVITGLVTIAYSTLGGIRAVVWGDVIQGIVLVVGAVLSLGWLIFHTEGGVYGFLSLAVCNAKMESFHWDFDLSRPVFWVVLLGGFSANLITYTSDQTIIQRYMTTETAEKAARSIWFNAIAVIPITLLFFLTGTALFTYYNSHPAELAPSLDKYDAIYPYFIIKGLPPGVAGLLISAIFAAAMSTLSSNINSASAAICSDFIKVLRPTLSAKYDVIIARIIGVGVGLLGILMALLMATWNIQSLWDQFNTFLGLFTGTIGALFFMGFFMKKVNGTGAACGVIISLVALFTIKSQTNISFLLFGLIEVVLCCLIAWLVSVFTRDKSS